MRCCLRMKAQHAARFGIYLSGWSCWRWALTGWGHRPLYRYHAPSARGPDGICQPDLDRIPHSGCGTVRDQGAGRLIDLLQIVVSIVFTRFIALFQHTITCQSVFYLPATRNKARNGALWGLDCFCPIVSCNLSSVFIYTKRAAFLLPHGKNAALFQMLILRWILQFDLAEHVKIIPIMDARGAGRGLRAGVGTGQGSMPPKCTRCWK